MDNSSISSIEGRVEMLRREIAMIQQAELNYRGHRNHSLEDKAEHDKRGFRILAIRENFVNFATRAHGQQRTVRALPHLAGTSHRT
jgi:hypothetical protein